ncbi:MAG: molybdopterin molybdenumtransferase MoeA, partial [Planctomycetaceae bacterium]
MLTVEEALSAIEGVVVPLPTLRVPLADSLGLVLAEAGVADLDSPPFDKSLMDGYAVRSEDVARAPVELRIIEEVLAGGVPRKALAAGDATKIMTGAPIPAGADAVVPVEQTVMAANGAPPRVTISVAIASGRNILKRGESTRAGDTVVPQGRLIRAMEVGCLAELGRHTVKVVRRPRVAVLATGDELVPITEKPGPGQIRNSNEAMLVAQLRQAGVDAFGLGIARDDKHDLRSKIEQGLKYDVLVLSGGVSAGQVDLVPLVLAEAGVTQIFHKVRVKPGQPLWFGLLDRGRPATVPLAPAFIESSKDRCYVFGLPGNPVSSLVCCELFVRTALRKLAGVTPSRRPPVLARLSVEHRNSGSRPTYHPVQLSETAEGLLVAPVRWIGS